MSGEHRLSFELFRVSGLEATALDSIVGKLSISKRYHEYVRRIMVQGLVLTKILNKLNKNVLEIQNAVSLDCSTESPEEFKVRLNVEVSSTQYSKTPEEEIWEAASKISKRDERKHYLRRLFLHGYWFESLPDRDETAIGQLFAAENAAGIAVETTVPPAKISAKSKLGDLMPV